MNARVRGFCAAMAVVTVGIAAGFSFHGMASGFGQSASRAAAPLWPSFVIGYNQAWFGNSYGRSFTTDFDESAVRAAFLKTREGGGSVIRLWLFEIMQGLEVGGGAPRVVGVRADFLEHLERTLQIARETGVTVYLTLMDGNGMPADKSSLRDYYWNLLNDLHGEGEAFREKVLRPTLALATSYRDSVFALDLMNEIQAPIARHYWSDPWQGPRAWIRRHTEFVHAQAPWLKVTSSLGWEHAPKDLTRGLVSDLGLDFYDLHLYDDAPTGHVFVWTCDRARRDRVPILLGEFGQKTQKDDDALQLAATKAFLKSAKESCYRGVLAWRLDAAEKTWRFLREDGSFRPAAKELISLRDQAPSK